MLLVATDDRVQERSTDSLFGGRQLHHSAFILAVEYAIRKTRANNTTAHVLS